MSFYPLMVNPKRVKRSVVFTFLLPLFFAAAASVSYGQFTLTPSQLHPASVDPGTSATATIAVLPAMGTSFNSAINFTCAAISSQTTTNLPACLVSPASATPGTNGAQVSLTITTSGTTAAGTYQITVTGASGSTVETAILYLNVADLTEDYTISVLPTTAIPSPVTAGSNATTTITVAPLGSYTGTVTLSCLSVTPVVTGAPVCSFQYASGKPFAVVTGGAPPTATLTIATFGTTGPNKTSNRPARGRVFYALWLAVPALGFVGLRASGSRGKKLIGVLMLVAVACGLLFLPACGSSTTNTAANQITPTNTYTFTLSGADANGAGPSSTTAATVTLQVTAD